MDKNKILSLWSIVFNYRSKLVDNSTFTSISASVLFALKGEEGEFDTLLPLIHGDSNSDSLKGSLEYASIYIPIALSELIFTKRIANGGGVSFGFTELDCFSTYYKSMSTDKDFTTVLDAKGYKIRNISAYDYCTTLEYLEQDILTLCRILGINTEDDSIFEKEAINYYVTVAESTVDYVLQVYTDLFSSGYEVLQPYGILSSSGCLTIDVNNNLWISKSLEFSSIYNILSSKLNLTEYSPRDFQVSAIESTVPGSKGKQGNNLAYFPYKLLEYALGRDNASNSKSPTHYPVHKSSVSWGKFQSDAIRTGLKNALMSTIVNKLKADNMLCNDEKGERRFISTEAGSTVRLTCEKFKYSVTNCILVSQWKSLGDTGRIIGFKIRVVDMSHTLPGGTSVVEEIIESAFSGNRGDSKVIPPAVSRGDNVKEFSFQFDPMLCEAEPLFAYVALDSIKRRGIRPSWDNLILGKNDNDSILSTGKDGISFYNSLTHWIIAGSRSGKGVMTLNILASAIASGKPIFYLDRKPDMASLMMSLSKRKMFVVNGGDVQADSDTYNEYTTEKMSGWNKHIPEYLTKGLQANINDYTKFGDIFYLRAMFFVYGIIGLRASNKSNKGLYDKLGGDDGIILVIDEFTNALNGMNDLVKSHSPMGASFIGTKLRTQAKGKPDKEAEITPFHAYSTTFIDKLNSSLDSISKGMNAGWGNSEKRVSNVFVLGQKVKSVPSASADVVSYKTNAMNGVSAGQDAEPIQTSLLKCASDGFFGYNRDESTYMGASNPNGKSHSRLNSSARNFAYVSQLGVSEMNKVTGGDKTTSDGATYFKPFLILNDAEEDGTYVSQFKSMLSENSIRYDDVKKMHNVDGVLQPKIGFERYIEAMFEGSDIDIAKVLGRSYAIGNYVVKKLGYVDGDVLDFIHDLRPEWMFSISDMATAFNGNDDLSVRLAMFKDFASDVVSWSGEEPVKEYSSGANNIFNSNQDISSLDIDLPEDDVPVSSAMEVGGSQDSGSTKVIFDDPLANRSTLLDDVSEPTTKPADEVEGTTFDFIDDAEVPTVSSNEIKEEVPVTEVGDIEELVDDDAVYDLSKDSVDDTEQGQAIEQGSTEGYDESNSTESQGVTSNPEVIRMREEIKNLRETIAQMQAFMMSQDMQSKIKEEQEKIKDKEIPQERVLTEPHTCRFFNKVFKIQQYNAELDIPEEFTPTDDFAESITSFKNLSTYILNDIDAMFGGLDRITDFAVMSNALVLNSVAYSPQVPDKFISSLPLDIRNDVKNGRFAWVFDFSNIKKFSSLTNLLFNDTDFVYKKVRVDLNKGKGFEPKDLFSMCPRLNFLQLGEYEFSRNSRNAHDSIFHESRRSTEIADAVESWGINATKSNWESVKSIYRNPEKRGFWKGVQVVGMTGITTVTGVGTLGVKAGRKANKLGSRVFSSIKEVYRVMKENN